MCTLDKVYALMCDELVNFVASRDIVVEYRNTNDPHGPNRHGVTGVSGLHGLRDPLHCPLCFPHGATQPNVMNIIRKRVSYEAEYCQGSYSSRYLRSRTGAQSKAKSVLSNTGASCGTSRTRRSALAFMVRVQNESSLNKPNSLRPMFES